MDIEAPSTPGHFTCEFDLVHEGVTWFGDRGSCTVHRPIDVVDLTAPPSLSNQPTDDAARMPPRQERADPVPVPLELPPTDDLEIGEFPIFAVPRDTVVDLLALQGAAVFNIETDERSGPEWCGFRYYARRLR